jgi:hypothetical protein
VTNLALVALFSLAAMLKLWIVTYPDLVIANSALANPAGAVNFLVQADAKGRVFNEYNWGGYIIWNDQNLQVFVDGRTDLYGDPIISEWIQIMQAQDDWAAHLDQWKIEWVLVELNRPLVGALPASQWEKVYSDDHSVLLQRISSP